MLWMREDARPVCDSMDFQYLLTNRSLSNCMMVFKNKRKDNSNIQTAPEIDSMADQTIKTHKTDLGNKTVALQTSYWFNNIASF